MRYIVAIDQSTSASKAFLVDEGGFIVERGALEHKQHYPAPGRVEHDASEIWHNVQTLIDNLIDKAGAKNVAAIAISNQRETTVLWDAASGEPVCPAIVWQDVRGEAACRELAAHAERVHEITGLYLSPYFPAGKVRSLFAERQDLKARAEKGELRLGTIDSYLVYRLTGGKHLTDATNASRTQLMELRSLTWSAELLDLFGIPAFLMPEAILGADGDFGSYRGIPITGVLGDSHAALFGQGCHRPGMAKATYGTGSSVMMNVGDAPVISRHGLSASVAFRVGGRTDYALEGNVTCSGDTLVWLCHDVGLFEGPQQIEALAGTVDDSRGASLVPAFSGLGAPYFDSDARALLCGMDRGVTRAHIARAALESIAQQDADVLEVMRAESGYAADTLLTDGGPTKNRLLMQMQADLANCDVRVAVASELSALGAAYIAGLKTGVFAAFDQIRARERTGASYSPAMPAPRRAELRAQWKAAIERARIR